MGLSLGQEPVSEPRGKHSPCAHGACFGDRQHTDSCGLNIVLGGDRCRGETEAGWRPGGAVGRSVRNGSRGCITVSGCLERVSLKRCHLDVLGGPAVKTLHFHCNP